MSLSGFGAAKWIANFLDLRAYRRKAENMSFHSLTPFPGPQAATQVAFHRTELSLIMSLYGRMVAAGE